MVISADLSNELRFFFCCTCTCNMFHSSGEHIDFDFVSCFCSHCQTNRSYHNIHVNKSHDQMNDDTYDCMIHTYREWLLVFRCA